MKPRRDLAPTNFFADGGCLSEVGKSVADGIVVHEGDEATAEFEALSETIVLETVPATAEALVEQIRSDAEQAAGKPLVVTIPDALARAALIEVEINKLAALRSLQGAAGRVAAEHWSGVVDTLSHIANQLRDAIAAARLA